MLLAIHAANQLLLEGHCPIVPHLSIIWDLIFPHDRKTWLDYDNELLKGAEGLLRLPGESGGSDDEVALAGELGLPVWHDIDMVPPATAKAGKTAADWAGHGPGGRVILKALASMECDLAALAKQVEDVQCAQRGTPRCVRKGCDRLATCNDPLQDAHQLPAHCPEHAWPGSR